MAISKIATNEKQVSVAEKHRKIAGQEKASAVTTKLQRFRPYVLALCGLPDDYGQNLAVTSVSFSEDSEGQKFFAIGAEKHFTLENVFRFQTPKAPVPSALDREADTGLLAAIVTLIVAAESIAAEADAQPDMFRGEEDESGDDDPDFGLPPSKRKRKAAPELAPVQ